jgi:hypothetical protein
VARLRQSIVQRDFSAGELREEFLERHDTEIRARSLRVARNLRLLAAGGMEARPGTTFLREADYRQIHNVIIAGTPYVLLIGGTDLVLIDAETHATVYTLSPIFWDGPEGPWVVHVEDYIIIGGQGGRMRTLFLDPATGNLKSSLFLFENELYATRIVKQPYWAFRPDVTITPSARTGAITVTASGAVFDALQVGSRIRYAGAEIFVTAVGSATSLSGSVVNVLPASWSITVASTAEFVAGDVVVGQTSGFMGVVVYVTSGTVMEVLTTENNDGPDASEKLSGPRATTTVSSRSTISPLPTSYWDEPMFSNYRGWPRGAATAQGRLFLFDSESLPSGLAASSVRSPMDFEVGTDDDDAIARVLPDRGARFRHAVMVRDLLIFSDKGVFVQDLSNVLTPSSFAPVLVDARGCNGVRPCPVQDGVVYVGTDGSTILAARLDGNIYLKWSVAEISTFAPQQNLVPVMLCGPSLSESQPEKYLLIVNEGGTMGVASLNGDNVAFVQWDTQGEFVAAAPVSGGYYLLVDRDIGEAPTRFLERLTFGMHVDCAVMADPNDAGAADHLVGETASIVWGGRYCGDVLVEPDGSVPQEDVTSAAQIGFNFEVEAAAWPVEAINTAWAGIKRVRATRFAASVQGMGEFQMRCNAFTRTLNGYNFGDDTGEPSPLKERRFHAPVSGRPEHNDMAVLRQQPGPWRVLALAQEVTS